MKLLGKAAAELHSERDLRRIVDTVLHLAKSTAAEETEVHIDEVANALTRFANNAIHQNVAEHGLTVSVRTVTDGRTARATTTANDRSGKLRLSRSASSVIASGVARNAMRFSGCGRRASRVTDAA